MPLLLTRQTISERLASFKSTDKNIRHPMFRHPVGASPIPAAVLIPIIHRAAQLSILLTKRTSHLKHHAGQVSFPGGRVSDGDENRKITALRETQEEIGLNLDESNLLGRLPEYDIRTGFRVTPVVAWIESPFDCVLDPFEVDSIFEVPMEVVLDLGNYKLSSQSNESEKRYFYRLQHLDHEIWGATAGMLYILASTLLEV